MDLLAKIRNSMPEFLKPILKPIYYLVMNKYSSELSFWKSRYIVDRGVFDNSHYKKFFLAMANENDDRFLEGKIIADFGCGPRGSLVWISNAALKIGIDVLSDSYVDNFPDNIKSHGMIYLKSTEKHIPIPSDFADVVFTLNAMDHVADLSAMCGELIRILKPGGEFIGSFNLNEPATPEEPQSLTEMVLKDNIMKYLDIKSYRLSTQGKGENKYQPLFDNHISYKEGDKAILWVRGRKIG